MTNLIVLSPLFMFVIISFPSIIVVEAHYGGNRQRNRVVREDHPRARQEQEKEIEEALAIRNLQEQISRDQ